MAGPMKYRPEIDGLRTVAVLPVVFYHAGLGPLHGGFAGVDIFFVISGYLITSLIIGDIEAGRFSIATFYERRARRILPALFVVLLASTIAAWRIMYPLEMNEYGQSMVATMFFSSNIFFWLKSDYFSTASELKPLLHTWSLAVEEQYYIFFPLLMAFIWKGARRHVRVLSLLACLAVASLMGALALDHSWQNEKFYLLPFRAWELLMGAACAIALSRWSVPACGSAAYLGLGLIAWALVFSSDQGWPSWQALLPTVGTAMIILFADSEGGPGRHLAGKWMVAGGLISYSLYLWHQPLFAFARLRLPDEPSTGLKLALIAGAVLLSVLTWRCVEQPFRARREGRFRVPVRPLVATVASCSVLTVAVGLMIDAKDGWAERTAPSGLSFARIERDLAGARTAAPPCDTDLSFRPAPVSPAPQCIFPAKNRDQSRRAILLGDSHATVLTPALVKRLTAEGYETTVATFGGCIPFPGYRTVARDCDAANSAMLQHVEKSRYDLIVLAFRPQPLLTGEERLIPVGTTSVLGNPADYTVRLMQAGLKKLLDSGAEVIVFEPVPEMPRDIGHFARNIFAFNANHQGISFSAPLSGYMDRAGPVLSSLRNAKVENLRLIPTSQLLCDEAQRKCLGIEDGVALYVDSNHLSKFGVEKLLAPFEKELLLQTRG